MTSDHSAEKDAPQIETHADLCHKGNYENIIGQPDMVHTPTPGVIPNLVWFVCAGEANGLNMFPCTGSRHIDHRTAVVCTCSCHQVARVIPPGSGAS